jgi:phosphohistidine phosphatase SixA
MPLKHRLLSAPPLLFLLLVMNGVSTASADERLWTAIKSEENIVLIVRHAEITGPNPTHFDPSGNCQGESMLTPKGRADARLINQTFLNKGVAVAALHVVSSAMCRTRDTAMIAFGKAELDPDLREFFSGSPEQMNKAMDAAERWIKKLRGRNPLVIVTHLPNIDALTGEQPGYHQMLVARADAGGQLDVLGMVRLY